MNTVHGVEANSTFRRYVDMAAIKAHGKFPEFKEANKQMVKENLLAGKTEVHLMAVSGGMASRL